MDWKSAVLIFFLLALFPTVLLWWNREAIKRALLEYQKLQAKIDKKRNEEANVLLRKKILDRKKKLSGSVDPNDPWNGVR